jgi:CheY-like chemotaxis protein
MKNGPIIIIEDDTDDREILNEILQELNYGNKLIFFERCPDALHYLMSTTDKPLIIICDVNIPVMNGLELRRRICENDYLKKKSIPFVFLSTNANPKTVEEAYQMMVQGYFEKPPSIEEIKGVLKNDSGLLESL